MRNYEEMNSYLGLRKGGRINTGLESMNKLLKKLGDPHKELTIIHIAGTNGKGSTGAYLQSMMTQAGYTVGVFSSPFLHAVNEHIKVNGSAIDDRELQQAFSIMKAVMTEEDLAMTEFEAITAAAFLYFGTMLKADFCIIEAGMGGTWDSTNVVAPVLSVITNVGSDHSDYLGSTLSEIAEHKAGIIKPHVPVITGRMEIEPLAVIKKKAKESNSPLFLYEDHYRAEAITSGQEGESFLYQSLYSHATAYSVSMLGEHQTDNAALALMAIETLQQRELLTISAKEKAAGLISASVPGRFERMLSKPLVYLDGAHNPQGAAALSKLLKKSFFSKKIHVVFSVLADKQKEEMLEPLYEPASSFTFTEFKHVRAGNMKKLYEKSSFPNKRYIESWKEAVSETISQASEEDVVIITGSLYFIAEIRKNMKDFPPY